MSLFPFMTQLDREQLLNSGPLRQNMTDDTESWNESLDFQSGDGALNTLNTLNTSAMLTPHAVFGVYTRMLSFATQWRARVSVRYVEAWIRLKGKSTRTSERH